MTSHKVLEQQIKRSEHEANRITFPHNDPALIADCAKQLFLAKDMCDLELMQRAEYALRKLIRGWCG